MAAPHAYPNHPAKRPRSAYPAGDQSTLPHDLAPETQPLGNYQHQHQPPAEHEYGHEDTRARQGYEGQVGAEGRAYYAEGYAGAYTGYPYGVYDEDANSRESTRKVCRRALPPPPQLHGRCQPAALLPSPALPA